MFHEAILAGLTGAQVLSPPLLLLLTFWVSALGHALVGRTPGTCKL